MHQKSQDKRLKDGDRNIKFFHASVKTNQLKNQIEKLIDDDGNTVYNPGSMGEVARNYFRKLFKSSRTMNGDTFFSGFIPKVNAEMNMRLTRTVTVEEIREAIFSIKSSSAPGIDGMTGLFF